MSREELEKLAAAGRPMPAGLEAPDIMLFQTLAALYLRYRAGALSREQASAEKQKIITAYSKLSGECSRLLTVYKTYQENIRAAGMALSGIEKAQKVTEIALKACEAVGLMTGDEGFLNRQKKKIMKEDQP